MDRKKYLTTERLLLRPFTLEDAAVFFDLCSDYEVMRFIGDGSLPSFDAVQKSIERWVKHYDDYGYSLFALLNNENLMGFCGLITQEIKGTKKVELGYRLGRKFWGNGYATEAAICIRDYAFNDCNLSEIISIIQPANIASRKIANKIGMNFSENIIFNNQPVCIYCLDEKSFSK